jgi:hypothetical protein
MTTVTRETLARLFIVSSTTSLELPGAASSRVAGGESSSLRTLSGGAERALLATAMVERVELRNARDQGELVAVADAEHQAFAYESGPG